MEIRLCVSTIVVLLLLGLAFTLVETSTLKSKKSALRNLATYTEENGETTCSDDIEEILYFLTLGNEDIERTEVGEVIIVLGSSGVGKSTLTQFVANETNTLRVNCTEWGHCSVIDDSDTIGEDLISKTFLPNLVFHESTQTPFYDMPGFNDNRNESMEIANSFFMQQILDDAEKVKILVLAKFASFQNSAKLDFKNLLRNLVDLIKFPVKFRGGMAIVSTMAENHSHENITGQNIEFLKESLLGSIPELFQGDDKYIRGSTEIVENWLESDTGNYFDANYYSYFLRATNPGPFLEDPKIFNNKKLLEEVIWDRLNFVPKESGDVGLPMSGDAKLKVKEVGLCIARTLATKMETFSEELDKYIRTNVTNLTDGKERDFVHIAELFTNITTADFTFVNMEGQPLSVHLQKLLDEINNFEIPSLNEIRQQIEDTLTFIEFIELTNVEIDFDPRSWIIRMGSLGENLIRFIGETGLSTSTSLAREMDKSSEGLQNYIRISVLNIIDGKQTGFVQVSELITNFTALDFSFNLMEKQALSTYLQNLLGKVSSLQMPFLDGTRRQIEDTLTLIQFIELTSVHIEFDPRLWVFEMNLIKGNLIKYFDSQVKELLDATISWFAKEAKLMAEYILTKLESLDDISEKENLVTSEIVKVKKMFEEISSEKPTKNLTEFLGVYLNEFALFRGFPSENGVLHFKAFSVLEMFDDFSWSSKDWISASISTLQYSLENERDLTIFLRALFEDLSQPIVQTGDELELNTWWSNQTRLSASHFNCFYSKIIVQGFTSPLIFDKSRVKEFLFYKTQARKRLEFLLNFMLRNVYTCPNSSELIVTGPIISLDRLISRCINQQRMPTSIVLLATHKIYANSKLIGREINSDSNVNAILMSPELIVSNNAEIDLTGNVGEEGVHGKPAGTQYSLFQIITTDDRSMSTHITFPNVTGGPGVDGGDGSPGEDSTLTGHNNFNVIIEESYCAAWYTGYIQIREYANDCNSCTTPNEVRECTCYAGYDGRLVEIKGTDGPQGGRGGNGKDGSCGGSGGQSYYVDASNNFLLTPKTPANGLQGRNGVGGAGGQGGLGGLHENSRISTPSSERGPSGPSGSPGQNCTTQVTGKSVNETLVNYHFASFKVAFEDLSTNEFLSSQAKSFLNLLGSAELFS